MKARDAVFTGSWQFVWFFIKNTPPAVSSGKFLPFSGWLSLSEPRFTHL